VHFDIAALAILLIVLLTSIYRKMYKDMSSVVFLSMVGTTLLAAVFECAQIIMYAAGCRNDVAFMIVKSLYVLSHDFAAVMYFLYVISLAQTWHKMRQYPICSMLMCIPYLVNIVFGSSHKAVLFHVINFTTQWGNAMVNKGKSFIIQKIFYVKPTTVGRKSQWREGCRKHNIRII